MAEEMDVVLHEVAEEVQVLYIFETHPTRRHPTWRNDELTRRTWNQRGAVQVIKYDIYIS